MKLTCTCTAARRDSWKSRSSSSSSPAGSQTAACGRRASTRSPFRASRTDERLAPDGTAAPFTRSVPRRRPAHPRPRSCPPRPRAAPASDHGGPASGQHEKRAARTSGAAAGAASATSAATAAAAPGAAAMATAQTTTRAAGTAGTPAATTVARTGTRTRARAHTAACAAPGAPAEGVTADIPAHCLTSRHQPSIRVYSPPPGLNAVTWDLRAARSSLRSQYTRVPVDPDLAPRFDGPDDWLARGARSGSRKPDSGCPPHACAAGAYAPEPETPANRAGTGTLCGGSATAGRSPAPAGTTSLPASAGSA